MLNQYHVSEFCHQIWVCWLIPWAKVSRSLKKVETSVFCLLHANMYTVVQTSFFFFSISLPLLSSFPTGCLPYRRENNLPTVLIISSPAWNSSLAPSWPVGQNLSLKFSRQGPVWFGLGLPPAVLCSPTSLNHFCFPWHPFCAFQTLPKLSLLVPYHHAKPLPVVNFSSFFRC